ncbi:MAG: zinc-dependent peptidase [Bacteroidetes bacterium]|nr:zinc-dependent peptidase [Bacteroidota bacterium]MBU1371959.1 zinc-dependent peptidase [Bacteroidota bacterium]MBU1483561.1 zinc-dependent peptidase [Bacteroidota bacterium]MBU1759292.1 zinc-dependent peptidase [Bacteroidota bacterium]MBU2268261.1 zinc-dependent peptidase [Bacteroidota bacterium]
MSFLIYLIIAALLVYFLRNKKTTVVGQSPLIPENFSTLLNEHIDYYQKLDDDKKILFKDLAIEFLENTRIEGVGVELNDLDKVFVAASAVIPIFGFPGWHYKNLTNVILYPNTFDHDFQFEGGERRILGMVGSGYMNGQMILSRAALERGFSKNNGKENTAIHEFVHLLDKADGSTDGIPEILMQHQPTIPWLKMIHEEMRNIQNGKSDINPYALTNEAEFLAVAAEYFFEKPDEFEKKHPELYDLMSQMFLQDPASE